MNFPGIERALKLGFRLHGFRSGGGLRVISIEKNDEDRRGYGEHPSVDEALKHANEDFLAGGRPYKKVYGKLYPHYLTGSMESTGELDLWLLQGHSVDAWRERDKVVVQLKGLKQVEFPKDIQQKVIKTGRSMTWKNRGYTYRMSRMKFANDELGTSGKVIAAPKGERRGSDAWMYEMTKTGRGTDWQSALDAAFKAEERE